MFGPNLINEGKNKLLTRHKLLNSGARLFCRECQRIRRVIDCFGNKVRLECRHDRSIEPPEEA